MAKPDGPGSLFESNLAQSRQHRQDLSDVNEKLKQLVESLKTNKERIDNRHSPAPLAGTARPADDGLREHLVGLERENRRMFEQFAALEEQSFKLTGLYVALHRLHESCDLQEVLEALQEIVVNIIGSEQLAVFELDEPGGRLRLVHSMGIDRGRWREVALGEGTIGRVAMDGKSHLRGAASGEGERDLTACIPLLAGARRVGVLAIFDLLAHKALLGPFDHELLEALSIHAGSALRLAMLEKRRGEE